MDIIITNQSDRPIYEQIIDQMKFHVMKGYLKPGDNIPSVRKMALELKMYWKRLLNWFLHQAAKKMLHLRL